MFRAEGTADTDGLDSERYFSQSLPIAGLVVLSRSSDNFRSANEFKGWFLFTLNQPMPFYITFAPNQAMPFYGGS